MWTEQAATATVQCNGGVTLPTKMLKNNTTDNKTTMGHSLHLQFDHQEGVDSTSKCNRGNRQGVIASVDMEVSAEPRPR